MPWKAPVIKAGIGLLLSRNREEKDSKAKEIKQVGMDALKEKKTYAGVGAAVAALHGEEIRLLVQMLPTEALDALVQIGLGLVALALIFLRNDKEPEEK